MPKLSKPQQQFLLLFIGSVIGSVVGYLINQLPELKQLELPHKNEIVIGSVTLLTLISFFVAWKLAGLDGEGSVDKPEEYAVQQSRAKLLERLRKTWISGVLEKSLYHEARLELVLKEVKDQKQETLPPGTLVIQKFDELGQGGTMLILGEPGAGKTTTLLELARDLLGRAEQDVDAPLPVVLHLAAWNRRDCKKCSWLRFGRSKPEPQKLENWVIEELHNSPVIEDLTGKDRHYEIDRKVARYWLREQRLVLLLDGLDEVAPEQREDCVKAIREFRQAYRLVEMVVCCRTGYQELKAKLEFQQELMIQPLTLQQIEESLEKTTGNLLAIKNILPNEILQKIANCPFTLWMLERACKDDSVRQLPSILPGERIKFLLDLYIHQQLKHPQEYIRYQKEYIHSFDFVNQQKSQLIWIKRLAENFKSNFSINHLNIQWIIRNTNNNAWHQKTIAAINIFLLFGLAVMLNLGIVINNKSIPESGWLRYFSFFSLGAFFLVLTDFTFASFVEYPIERFIINEKPSELIRAYISACRNFLTFDLNELNKLEFPVLMFIVSVSFFFSFSILHYIQRLPQNILQILPTWLIFPLLWLIQIFFCLLIGLAVTFLIRLVLHYLLRALLTHGGLLPWHYHQFLDWTCDRFILQKLGDSYDFIHPTLREHFVHMDIERFIQWSNTRKVESSR